MQTKTCTKCGEEKALTEFHKHQTGKYGVKSECKECVCEYMREYERRPEVREYRLEYRRKYQQRPEFRSYAREYRQRPQTRERNRISRQDPDQMERKRKRNNENYRFRKEMGLVSNKHIEVPKKHATRSGLWSDAEVQFLMSSDLPLVDIALELGRTYHSVHYKRARLRKLQDSQ